jgi:sigma-E factor negative regulatory protein RseB
VLFRILAVLLTACSIASANDQVLNAQQWLEKMNHAMKTLNYHGTVIFMKNGQLDTMKYQHSVNQGIEQEQLSSLSSPLREVTRKANEVSCLFKETSQKIINHHPIDSSFIVNFPQDTANLDNQYVLAMAGKESVAMQPTQIISIQPRDLLRYARKIWVETQHFLPLKAEAYDSSGAMLEQVVFTDMQIDANNIGAPHEPEDQTIQIKHIHATQAEPFENAPFVLNNWPAGFKTVFYIRNSLEQSQKAVDHLLISDGFSSVSVYFGSKDDDTVQGLNSLGSVNSFSRVINNFQFTVLGEVPAKTVEYIASGISLR